MKVRVAALACLACLLVPAWPSIARAQTPGTDEARPAFSLSSNEVFTTRESPSFFVTFRQLDRLDFRVYKVRDPFAFFASLRDPHQLGSEEPQVPTERSWIERLADWKAGQRARTRNFLRSQVSREYRQARRASADRTVLAQRVTQQVTTFAQVPLLNPNQLVTSWREILPRYRDPELRRVPLEVNAPGVYLVEAVHDRLRAYTIVIVSDVGLVTKTSPGQLLLFAADRYSGEPANGCEIQVLASQVVLARGMTSADGTLELALPEESQDDLVSVARCGEHITASDAGAWTLSEPARSLVGMVYSDKPIYRPGHTVHLKSILRWRERDALLAFDAREVELSVADVNEKVVFRRRLAVDDFGAVHADFEVPATAALGIYSVRIASGDAQATGAFEVQEYRKPEFEVTVTPASRFVVQGNQAVAAVQARYYFGQPVANARVRFVVNQQPYYSPFASDDSGEDGGTSYWYGQEQQQEGELRLDAEGRGEIRIPLPPGDEPRDYSARIEAQVTDASSREVSGSSVVHATVGPFLISARTSSYVHKPGARVEASARAVDYTGNPQPNIALTFVLHRISYPDGYGGDSTATQIATANATSDAQGGGTVTMTLPPEPGSYRITARARAGGRDVVDQTWLWIPGTEVDADADDQYLELLADRRSYAPGDTARLMVRGAPAAGPVLVTKEGQLVSWYRLLRPGAADAIEVPIEPGDIGDVYVNVAFLRDGRLNRAERRLAVSLAPRTLQITLNADQTVARPRDPGTFSVQVLDALGTPVQAQVSLGVIDEAVYGVKADDTPDPVRFFHRREYSRVSTEFSRAFYFTGFSGTELLQLASGRKRRPYTLADFKGDRPLQPAVRKDFPDAIYWIGDLVTDAEGRAKVAIKYPDALTTWRLTARAVTRDTLAGAAVVRTTTTKDLIVRVITPRFLTEGDEVVLPTIVHNYVDGPRTANVAIEAEGLTPIGDGDAARATSGVLERGAERRNDWRYGAPAPGTARVTSRASTETDSDAVELPVPVLPYGLRREEGRSGSIAGTGEQSAELQVAASANTAGRTITVSLAPSLAGSMLGALDFLTSYPYGCTEQTLSSFLPNLLVSRTLAELQITPAERLGSLDRQVTEGLKRLYDYQHDDGGWGWWKTDENHPYMTAYALYGLAEARRAGYRVDEYRLSNGTRALAQLYATYPRAEPDLKTYMAYVLARVSTEDPVRFFSDAGSGEHRHDAARDELWAARDRLSSYGRALLLLTLDAAKDARGDELARSLVEDAQSRGELSWWASDRDPLLFDAVDTSVEATALAIQALAPRMPRDPLLERAVRWLVVNRSGGYWNSTKQTATAIYGLLELLRARDERPRPVSVDVYVNDVLAGTRELGAAELTAPDPLTITAPAAAGLNRIRIATRGDGAVYWAATASYFDTASASARSGSRQLAVTRRYARLVPVTRGNRIVYREEPINGSVAPGDVLSVRLTAAGSADWRYLVLEDPLPGGVEALQDTTAYPLERERRDSWWWGSRVEYRDSKTVFFQQSFEQGRYEFSYLVKVISAGQFRAIPAQIAPMYVPGVAASSDPATLTVTAPAEGSR